MRIGAIIQARWNSSRLPGKALIDIGGEPALQRVIDRVSAATWVEEAIVATTAFSPEIVKYCKDWGIDCSIGSENDIISRVLHAAYTYGIDTIVEITADCPLIDPEIIDQVIDRYLDDTTIEYCSNCVPNRSYPDGLDVQVYSATVLERMVYRSKRKWQHCGWNIPQQRHIRWACIPAPNHMNLPELRLTLDTAEDLKLIRAVYERFPDDLVPAETVVNWLRDNPQIVEYNLHIQAKKPEEG
jgi:spore coat polysaccharide biosynthesis protein SpsF